MSALDGAVGFLFEHPVALITGCAVWTLTGAALALTIGRAIEIAEQTELPDADDRPDLRIVR